MDNHWNRFEQLKLETIRIFELLKIDSRNEILNKTKQVYTSTEQGDFSKIDFLPERYEYDEPTQIELRSLLGPYPNTYTIPCMPRFDLAFKLGDIWLKYCKVWLDCLRPYARSELVEVLTNKAIAVKDLINLVFDYLDWLNPWDVLRAGDLLYEFVHTRDEHGVFEEQCYSIARAAFDKKYLPKYLSIAVRFSHLYIK